MERSAKLFQPQIAVVVRIGQDHYGNYRKLERTAAEKGKLVEALPAGGVAVLNADDPYVYAMRKRTRAQIITYGLSANAMVRGANVSCSWPKLLSLDIYHMEKSFHVQTQLLGEHWTYAVLAAITTGIAIGVSIESAIQTIEGFCPVSGRMSSHETSDGITFIRDDWKAPLWTVPASLDFIKKAKAERKIIVIGSISDTPKSFYHRNRIVIRQALNVVDKIIFVGDHARSVLKTRPYLEDEHIMAFEILYQLNSFLNHYLKAGDLVLLKSSSRADHLQRIVLSRINDIKCWREKCGKFRLCSDCRLQHSPFVPTDKIMIS